jgi:hypothetical protein
MRESDIEGEVTSWAEGLGALHLKLNVRGRKGWPDHIYLFHGKVVLMEFKLPGEGPEPIQTYVHTRLQMIGFKVWVMDNVKQAKTVLMRELFRID